jgi:hypothetical protein
MMSHRLFGFLTLAAAAALAGCSSSGAISRYTHETPQQAQQAAGHEAGVYLDGTGPAAQEAERTEARREAARQAQETRTAARPPRPSSPPAARAEDLSARTTGSRTQAAREPLKPYSDEWWEKENREDARLKAKMNICRGC